VQIHLGEVAGTMNRSSNTDRPLPQLTTDERVMREDLDVSGYCLIENAIQSDELNYLQDRLIEQAEMERKNHNHKNPANMDPVNQWVGMLLNKGEEFVQLIRHRTCMGLLTYLLGEQFIISCVDAQIQHPGATDMPLHTDQWWMSPPVSVEQIRKPPSDFARGKNGSLDSNPSSATISNIAEANVMWMVTDFTEENGGTRVVPRSHLSGRQPDPSIPHPVATVAITGPAGSAIAFDGRLWHGAAANKTSQSRFGITMAGCGPQFRPIENYTRGLRPETFAKLDSVLLKKLGFGSWSGYGHTGNPNEEVISPGEDAVGPLYRDNDTTG
jgi:ectoine hydroxylase-related dioxygenase (phytanoyl-CoA dioxygenase family)